MNKSIIIISILFLGIINIVSAGIQDGFENGDYTTDPTWSATGDGWSVSTTLPANGTYSLKFLNNGDAGYEYLRYNNTDDNSLSVGKMIQSWMKKESGASDYNIFFYGSNGNYLRYTYYSTSNIRVDCTGGDQTVISTATTNNWYFIEATLEENDAWNVSMYDSSRTYIASYNQTCDLGDYFDATEIKAYDHTDSGVFYFDDITYSIKLDENISINNQTYNMTSDGGCLVWRNDSSTNCNTTDGTPTLIFNTNVVGDCSIRASTSNGESYPAYNSSFACSTTGGTSHICTAYDEDKLDFGQNYLYASCTDSQAENSISGPLSINMTAGGGGGTGGLIDCITVLGTGCGVSIANDCAVVNQII